jgi:seryl-tRNA synthetase
MAKNILIRQISRITTRDEIETLEFNEGVNVITGLTNSGKTVWLKMLDFLLGDSSSVENALDNEDISGIVLSEKYKSVEAVIEIDSIEYHIQRQWKEQGLKSKIKIDGKVHDSAEFSSFILEKLQIPNLKFSKGNPYVDGNQFSLTFRTMLRHIYRQERFWNDIADQQYPSEQHAVISQFLGLAEKMFSPAFGEMIDLQKEKLKVESQKNTLELLLDQFGKNMTQIGDSMIMFTTSDSIKEKISSLEKKVTELINKRNVVVVEATQTVKKESNLSQDEDVILAKQRVDFLREFEKLTNQILKHNERIDKFSSLLKSVESEIEKFKRAKDAGDIFSEIRISHCPACHQEVSNHHAHGTCFLCHQSTTENASQDRLNFEISQLESEKKELKELVSKLGVEKEQLLTQERSLKESIDSINRKLEPIMQAVSALVNSQMGRLDVERGKIEEQIATFKRLENNLKTRDGFIKKITELDQKINIKKIEILSIESGNNEQASNELADGMMEYINQICETKPERWQQGRIDLNIGEKEFKFSIGRSKWSSVGGTLRAYFLFAYHYGLLKLSNKEGFHFPGLVILDLPFELSETGEESKKAENYLIEPFIKLCQELDPKPQIIIAGRSFEGLQNITQIDFEETWHV